jgi:integrase
MASVFFRGPRSTPRWFARYRAPDGVWRARRVRVETKGDAMKIARQLEAQAERRRYGLEPQEGADERVGALLARWESGLTNRSAYDDRSRLRKWIVPQWGGARISEITLAAVMRWLDELKASQQIASGTQRHLLGILSRFFSWAIERGHAQSNPCRSIPTGKRPRGATRREVPWIEDDGVVARIIDALPEPFDRMFYVANRSGLRLGEVCGLRVSDVAEIGAGAFRVRYSYGGPLKEDKAGGKVKWCPAPSDAVAVLGPWIERRRAETSDPEAFLFPGADGFVMRKEAVEYRWGRAREALGLALTWYEATRHSFASRSLSRGAGLDEVADALGHSTPAVTRRHYAHFVRRTFSSVLTAAMAPVDPAPVLRPSEPGGRERPRNPGDMTNEVSRAP